MLTNFIKAQIICFIRIHEKDAGSDTVRIGIVRSH